MEAIQTFDRQVEKKIDEMNTNHNRRVVEERQREEEFARAEWLSGQLRESFSAEQRLCIDSLHQQLRKLEENDEATDHEIDTLAHEVIALYRLLKDMLQTVKQLENKVEEKEGRPVSALRSSRV